MQQLVAASLNSIEEAVETTNFSHAAPVTGGNKKEDKPCVGNSPRLKECPSKSVIWNDDNLHVFWVPGLDVEDALKLVVITHECNQFEVK